MTPILLEILNTILILIIGLIIYILFEITRRVYKKIKLEVKVPNNLPIEGSVVLAYSLRGVLREHGTFQWMGLIRNIYSSTPNGTKLMVEIEIQLYHVLDDGLRVNNKIEYPIERLNPKENYYIIYQ